MRRMCRVCNNLWSVIHAKPIFFLDLSILNCTVRYTLVVFLNIFQSFMFIPPNYRVFKSHKLSVREFFKISGTPNTLSGPKCFQDCFHLYCVVVYDIWKSQTIFHGWISSPVINLYRFTYRKLLSQDFYFIPRFLGSDICILSLRNRAIESKSKKKKR